MQAIVVLDPDTAHLRVCGLSLAERGQRTAARAGATTVLTWSRGDALPTLDPMVPLLLLSAEAQVVHPPLVQGLAGDTNSIATESDGAFAGAAFVLPSEHVRVLTSLPTSTAAVFEQLATAGARRQIVQGLGRIHVRERSQVRAAEQQLLALLIKPQDNWITRFIYRPVSRPLTRALLYTPVSPNQVSYAVAALTLVGLMLAWSPSPRRVAWGLAVILAASYLDCCDGEIARMKLLSSRFGAWLDTIVDEAATVGTLFVLGWHSHARFGRVGTWDSWMTLTALGVVGALFAIYVVYFNLLTVVGSANSQDYAAEANEHLIRPGVYGLRPASASLVPQRPRHPIVAWFLTWAPHLGRRDFLTWASLFLALAGRAHWFFVAFALGSVVMGLAVVPDHVKLRRQIRAIRRRGDNFERVPAR